MQILVIDREPLATQLISSKLGARGYDVTTQPDKQAAFELIENGNFDCILVDPAPLAEARPVIIGIWKHIHAEVRPYILLLSKHATGEDALIAGANDVLLKPLSTQDLETCVGNAGRLMTLGKKLAAEPDIASHGGVVGKSAFNQLYLSAIDRAFRYNERSFVVFIELDNFPEIAADMGIARADALHDKLLERLTWMRRQSDVIGRIGEHDFAILLQRPHYETEPQDAINRFGEVLDKFCQSVENPEHRPQIRLQLIELPQGALHEERVVPQVAASETAAPG